MILPLSISLTSSSFPQRNLFVLPRWPPFLHSLTPRVSWPIWPAIRGCTLLIMMWNTFSIWLIRPLRSHHSLSVLVTLCRLISVSMCSLPVWSARIVLLSRFDPLLYWIVHSQWYAMACLLSVTYSTCQELSFRSLCQAASSRLLSSSTCQASTRTTSYII